ncbi:hypothetical protein PFISCL1PPCAC_18812, partial [Pristionchus fissidentatus]
RRLQMTSRFIVRHISCGRNVFAKIDKSIMQRSVVAGEADVTASNVITGDRMVVRLSIPEQKEQKSRRFRRQFNLPKEAVAGLREAIVKTERNPKQLQNEADQLAEKILNRRFPASAEIVKDARNKIRLKMRSKMKDDDDVDMLDENLSEQIREERERQLKNAVDKELKRSHFNWKPMEASSDEGAVAYALARLAPNYAEVARVLEELQSVDDGEWAPSSVLDFGAGAGGAFWALNERYEEAMHDYTAVDANDHMNRTATDIMRTRGSSSLVHGGVHFRRHLVPSLQTTYDMVIVHRTLIEISDQDARFQLAESLWRRTNRFLVLIESGLEDSFAALMDVRNFLLTMGMMLDKEKTVEVLKEHGKWNELTARLLHEERISDYERFEILKHHLPSAVSPPTMLSPATVVAPCPHDLGCPRQAMSVPCPFTVRWSPIRADGKSGRANDDGTEKGSMSFTILEKGIRSTEKESFPRILEMRKLHGHLTCDTCTAFRGLERITVSKRAGELYASLRQRRSGEIFPLHTQVLQSESNFDVFEAGLDRMKKDRKRK